MFEALEAGKSLSGAEFDALEQPLRERLLQAQQALADADYPVIIVIAGVAGAGKGALVHRLNEWMDPRGINTNTFWESSDEEESRPYFWRFWRKLPPRGQIGIFLGSWYTRPGQAAVEDTLAPGDFTHQCDEIKSFERMLTDDGAVIIKLWLHISEDTQRRQLEEKAPGKQQNPRVTDKPYELAGKYDRSIEIAEQIVLQTDSSHSPWHLIEAGERRYRDITAGEIILNALTQRAARPPAPPDLEATGSASADVAQPTVLDTVDLTLSLEKDKYKEQLSKYQSRLQDLAWEAYRAKRSVVAVFEGWDAAGKGSAIRRVTQAIDPRLYHLVQFAAPTDEERAHHYLWRFWRQLERDGRGTIFDRSWYGRVLVERVEGFARRDEWERAYGEINQFEEQLAAHGTTVVKFWIHISEDEQLARFQERESKPHKQHKITEEDWRNREKWNDYAQAVDQMIGRTSTRNAPWTLVSGNDKLYARIQILKTLCDALKSGLN